MYYVEHIDPTRTVLIVVDMENDFVAPGAPFAVPAAQGMLPQLKRALAFCRDHGIPVIYTTHAHRPGIGDKGLYAHDPRVAAGDVLAVGSPGVAIFPEIAPQDDEIVITKRRYSAFYGTDLEILLRGLGITTVVIAGVTTENCCHATARDAFYRDYQVVFLSDATATFDYPDRGQGALSAEEVHRATLIILALSTADVMTTEAFIDRVREASAVSMAGK